MYSREDRMKAIELYIKYDKSIAAVEHYLEHGRNLSRTVKSLGYPSKEALRLCCDELAPKSRKKRVGGLQYSQEQKKEAVIALCTRTGNAKEIAREYGVNREALYNWKNDLLRACRNCEMKEYQTRPISLVETGLV